MYSFISYGLVTKFFKLAAIKPLIKKPILILVISLAVTSPLYTSS